MISLLGTIVQCLRSGKKQQWHTSSVTNVCVGLLAGLKVLLLFMALILGYVCHQTQQVSFSFVGFACFTSTATDNRGFESVAVNFSGTDCYFIHQRRCFCSIILLSMQFQLLLSQSCSFRVYSLREILVLRNVGQQQKALVCWLAWGMICSLQDWLVNKLILLDHLFLLLHWPLNQKKLQIPIKL